MGININAPVTFRGNVGVNTSFVPNYPLQVGDSYAGGTVIKLLQPGQTLSYVPFNSQGGGGTDNPARVYIPYEEGKPHGVVYRLAPDNVGGINANPYDALRVMNARLTSTWSGENSNPAPGDGHLTKLPLYIGNSASEWFVQNCEEVQIAESMGLYYVIGWRLVRLEDGRYLNSCRFNQSCNCGGGNTNTLNWGGLGDQTGFVRYF